MTGAQAVSSTAAGPIIIARLMRFLIRHHTTDTHTHTRLPPGESLFQKERWLIKRVNRHKRPWRHKAAVRQVRSWIGPFLILGQPLFSPRARIGLAKKAKPPFHYREKITTIYSYLSPAYFIYSSSLSGSQGAKLGQEAFNVGIGFPITFPACFRHYFSLNCDKVGCDITALVRVCSR